FQKWVRSGVLKDILSLVAEALTTRATLTCRRHSLTALSRPPRREGTVSGRRKAARGQRSWGSRTAMVLPVPVHVESATPHEVTLVKATIAQKLVLKRPEHLVGDAAYESDQLDAELAQRGIELIAPHRRDRKRKTQDGRPLRRYRRRWKVERLFAWLQNYRRIVVRYERYPENFLGMLHLACWLILMRCL